MTSQVAALKQKIIELDIAIQAAFSAECLQNTRECRILRLQATVEEAKTSAKWDLVTMHLSKQV